MNELNIYQRLLKITEELGMVAKNLSVGTGGSSYKAVGEAGVLSAVKPLEIKHGIYSYPMERELVSQEIIRGEKKGYKKDDPPIQTLKFFMRLKTTYRFVNTDKPSEFVDQVSYGDGIDSLDKAPGKAETYSDKYSLMKAYKIMTGDDPDQNHSNDVKVTGKQKPLDGARITAQQKDTLITQIAAGKNELQDILGFFKIASLDDLNFNQAKQVIAEGEK